MGLKMSGVDVRELMREMYCGVMVSFTRVDGVGEKKLDHFSICVCHPCIGAMLIVNN